MGKTDSKLPGYVQGWLRSERLSQAEWQAKDLPSGR
ncbi:hypothetical protein RD1_1238 [Roseobacter denitrificans OCh 114]|uniref:Uncharacterized protein n=1 Tax=Roseobacter denitrificans (strain ATCC 33942 / OCh 114) TaxID=375451 RepID=Q16AV7_ROSDO|nr:hypothetical protein RD1_1238 [Roseobacter denitrificans OCh 114]